MVRAADREDRSGIGEMRVRQLPRAGDGRSYSCARLVRDRRLIAKEERDQKQGEGRRRRRRR